ncbi:MAG: class I adenylate-forming enzyme family protein [Betaproteobacteria bacterium]
MSPDTISSTQKAVVAQVTPTAVAFCDLPALIAQSALIRPGSTAIVDGKRRINYATLDKMVDRVAASLQRDGVAPKQAIAICAATSAEYVAVFLGVLRAGAAVAPLAPSATPAQLIDMLRDADAQRFFVDGAVAAALDASGVALPDGIALSRLDADGHQALPSWLVPVSVSPMPVLIEPAWPFNIIYSSGTTGTPKGIVQSHLMRWLQAQYAPLFGFGPSTVTMVATPLYSNTTMTTVLPTLAFGGCLVLMAKFEASAYLKLAQDEGVTHAMLVPVQYQRLMSREDFGRFDLKSSLAKFCTSAPLSAALKADVVARWPGILVEYYGMTEGGGTCMLLANLHPTKLHTVGQPLPEHDIRLIDEQGVEVVAGQIGEVVGRSATMMTGYHSQPGKTSEAEWFDAQGNRFIRTGDVGRFDEDGFLILLDRRKDMIISGGFNIYPTDLEAVLGQHPAVANAAVVGVPSAEWGETPVAFVVRRTECDTSAGELLLWANRRLGKTQRLKDLRLLNELPRSAIGKILKRELRDSWIESAAR